MSRIKTVLACMFLISSLAAPVLAGEPILVASGKWDLWDDSADTSQPDREKVETPAKKQAETKVAPVKHTSGEGETKTGDVGRKAEADDARQPHALTGHEAQAPEQTATSAQKPVDDGQPRNAGTANQQDAKTGQGAALPKQNAGSAQSLANGGKPSITDDTHQPDAKTAQSATVPQQPVKIERKDAETGRPVKTVTPDQPADSASVKTTARTKEAAPAAGSPPVSSGTVPVAAGEEYIIGPGDLLDISVWKDEVLSRTVVVLADGTISFPLIGKVQAAGRTINQVKDEIVRKLVHYYPEPEVNMEVKQSNSMLIYVIGRVNAPGRQVLNANIDVIQALAMAGGLNPFAGRNKIKILRKDGGKTVVLPFRYDDVIEGKIVTNIELKRGDVVVVP